MQMHRVLTSLFLFCAIAAPGFAQTGNGSLKITSYPSGATVTIDGVNTGKITPMSESLPVGQHLIVVAVPNSGWNPDTRTVTVVAGNNDLSVTLLPTLTTGPQGPIGPAGLPGPAGPQGPAGTAGLLGPVGPQGQAGPTALRVLLVPKAFRALLDLQDPLAIRALPAPTAFPGLLVPRALRASPDLLALKAPAGADGLPGPAGPQGPPGPTNLTLLNSNYARLAVANFFSAKQSVTTSAPSTQSLFVRNSAGMALQSEGTTYGVFGYASGTGGTGVYAVSADPSGAGYGVFGESSSAAGVASVAHNKANGKLFSGRTGPLGTEVFKVDGAGAVYASSYRNLAGNPIGAVGPMGPAGPPGENGISIQGPVGPQGVAGPQGLPGVSLAGFDNSPTSVIANSSTPSALVKALSFETIQSGAVKITWDDYRLGLFGVPNGSMCRYQAFIDNTLWGGERRIEVNGASTVPTTDHGTYTFFGPSLAAGVHNLSLYVISGGGANCHVGWGGQNPGASSLIVESYPTN